MIKMDETFQNVARIKVIGVGGAGGNAVNRMVKSGFSGVEFIAINTDQLALDNSLADVKISIGAKITKGLGAGARPERGFQAIQEDRATVAEAIDGADMVFITAGMGGGTGTGAAPVVAEIAREKGILSVAVVTRPFGFEGPVREKNSRAGFDALRQNVDTIIVIQNQKILQISSKQTQVSQAFKLADDVLSNAVRGICDIILNHGQIQVDFADVKTVMENGGDALMGTGVAEGEGRALAAAERAIHSPLLDDIDIGGASGVLVNITHGSDFGILELHEVMNYINVAVGEENQPNIIFGIVENSAEDYQGKVSVTVIAAGFHKDGQAIFDAPSPLSQMTQRIETVTPAQPVYQAPATVVAPVVAQPAPVAAPQQSWEAYAAQFQATLPPETAFVAPTVVSPIAQSAQPAMTAAPTMVAPAPVFTQVTAAVAELPNPFVAPYLPETAFQPSIPAVMDVRRVPQTEEIELRPMPSRATVQAAPQNARHEVPDPSRFDSLMDSPRPQAQANHADHGHRKVESRSTGTVSVNEFYNQPMDDDQDRDVPAFLRNPF